MFGNVASTEGDMAPSIPTDFGENHGRVGGRLVSEMAPLNLSHLRESCALDTANVTNRQSYSVT